MSVCSHRARWLLPALFTRMSSRPNVSITWVGCFCNHWWLFYRVKLLFFLKRKCVMSILDNSLCRRLPCVLSSCRGQGAARESDRAILKIKELNLLVVFIWRNLNRTTTLLALSPKAPHWALTFSRSSPLLIYKVDFFNSSFICFKFPYCGFCSNRILHHFPLFLCWCVYRRDVSTFLNYLMI